MTAKLLMGLLALGLGFSIPVVAEETVGEKIENTTQKAGDGIKKGYRNAKDKTCEMVNGKMECLGKKVKHKVQNGADKVETKTEEVVNKTN